jgi:hypothetical protein
MDLITTPFDRTATAAEVIAGVDLAGRRAIVTARDPQAPHGVAAYAVDPANATRLWALSEALLAA